MPTKRKVWALVLAAGEGRRLWQLTSDAEGQAVPKQFCSLRGGRTMLEGALERARRVAPPERTVVVVAAEHERWWRGLLGSALPLENVVVQPRNRGTAAGILLPLLAIVERDPRARVVVLPSDHHVGRELVLEASLRLALDTLGALGDGLILLGFKPDGPETDYGWILPQGAARRDRRSVAVPVAAFVEKPGPERARELMALGGLWNAFLFVATARTLVRLYGRHAPELLSAFRDACLLRPRAERAVEVERLYRDLGVVDFSRHLLQVERELLMQEVPACGWIDLGTPERVARCLSAFDARTPSRERELRSEGPRAFDLSAALGSR